MTSVLGLELDEATRLLEAKGLVVLRREVRSKKGVDGNERRVVRCTETGDGAVELLYAVFKTTVECNE